MKHLLLTTIALTSLLTTTAFADPIHDDARSGNLAGVQAELDTGVNVNAKEDGCGTTPLQFAAGYGHKAIAELLIAKGANVKAKNNNGFTALHLAASEGHKEVVELLIANGADVNARDGDWTPLHGAADGGTSPETVELLIAKGADVNAKAMGGETPLHWVFDGLWVQFIGFFGCGEPDQIIKVVELLVSNGADVNAKDEAGETPMDYAYESDCDLPPELDFLRKYGAKTSEELKALMPRLTYGRGLFDFSFTAKDGMTYVVEVTQDFKQWGELETIDGTGKQVKFTDPRQPKMPFKRNFYRVKVVE